MKQKFFLVVLSALLFMAPRGFSQVYDSLFNKAVYYYSNQEYQLAIPVFNECIGYNPKEFRSYMFRGNCYLELGLNNRAIQDYKSAMNLKSDYSELIYNLGAAYEGSSYVDSAIYFFRKYASMEPGNPEGYVRLSLIFMDYFPESGDSAIYYAGKSVLTDPGNLQNINLLAMTYYADDKYGDALETARLGLKTDSSYFPLNQTAGICCFYLKDYSSALDYFSRAAQSNPDDLNIIDYKIQSMLLLNTSQEKIRYSQEGRVFFNHIRSHYLKKIKGSLYDPGNEYFYNVLAGKFKDSVFHMSLDEFMLFYLGAPTRKDATQSKNASPYSSSTASIADKAGVMEEYLYINPSDFPFYLQLAGMYLELGNKEKYFENRFKYIGFAEAIKASGDGLSPATSYIINDESHEHSIMTKLGMTALNQSATREKRQYYDILTTRDKDNKEVKIYFLLDLPSKALKKRAKKQA